MGHHAPAPIRTAGPRRPEIVAVRILVASMIGLVSFAGCSQSGSFTQRHGMVGALKSNVAQLDSEKEKLARELADLKAENRRIEGQLAEVEAQNGDLAARLDDARAVMSRQGIEDGRSARSASDDQRKPSRKATPAKAPAKGKKTPFAQIPSERRDLDESEESDSDDLLDSPKFRRRPNDLDAQSRADDRSPWTPMVKGQGSQAKVVK